MYSGCALCNGSIDSYLNISALFLSVQNIRKTRCPKSSEITELPTLVFENQEDFIFKSERLNLSTRHDDFCGHKNQYSCTDIYI